VVGSGSSAVFMAELDEDDLPAIRKLRLTTDTGGARTGRLAVRFREPRAYHFA